MENMRLKELVAHPSNTALALTFGGAFIAFVLTHLLKFPGTLAYLMDVTGGQPILDLAPAFTTDELYARVAGFGEEGRTGYRRLVLTMDVVFPLALFVFLFVLSRFTLSRATFPRALRLLVAVAPASFFVSDLIENGSIYLILREYPLRFEMAGSLGYLTVFKRSSLYVAIALPVLLNAWSMLGRHFSRRRNR